MFTGPEVQRVGQMGGACWVQWVWQLTITTPPFRYYGNRSFCYEHLGNHEK